MEEKDPTVSILIGAMVKRKRSISEFVPRKQAKRGTKGQTKTCGLCGSTEHREEQCLSKAGQKIRELKAKIRKLEAEKGVKSMKKQLMKKIRKTPAKSGKYRKNAKRRYRGKNAPDHGLWSHLKKRVKDLVRKNKQTETLKETPEDALQ